MNEHPLFQNHRPYTRWWWFYDDIKREDITRQLQWVRDYHFGGVEIAWMYPQSGASEGPRWLSPEWTDLVRFTKSEADRFGLGCDFTFSTAWPFGGSIVPEKDAAQVFGGLSTQRMEKPWELSYYGRGYILNHLDRAAVERYGDIVGTALKPAMEGSVSGLFSDSWEVFPEGLWSTGLDEVFRERFDYDLEPYKQDLDAYPDVRYDYRKLVSDVVLDGFFRPYIDVCRNLCGVSRVQCHGAPTDLVAAFSEVDIPESETLLFEPYFSAIPASGAALGGKPVVSCETFTCIYGYESWPANSPHHGQERVEDLKLLADSVFANGVNHIFWHGMPYNTAGGDNTFYATTHLGPDCAFIDQLIPFNQYMETVSGYMKAGRTYTDVAVYLPIEDVRMLHQLPEDRQTPAGTYYWEFQETARPPHLLGYHPLWVSPPFLEDATVESGCLRCGDAVFNVLYVDVDWLDHETLQALTRLAQQGARVCVSRRPKEPGRQTGRDFDGDVTRLMNQPSVFTELTGAHNRPPLVTGPDLPEFWCRVVDGDYHLFLAHPDTKRITYPMPYEGFRSTGPMDRTINLNINGASRTLTVTFEPTQSILLRMSSRGAVDEIALPEVR